jgi:translation initiation factor IF-1
MVLFGGGKPHSIVCGLVAFVAQYEDNLVLNVDREAAEHGAGLGRECGDRLQHELMRDSLALFDGEERVVQWERAYISMRTRHRTHGRIPGFSYREKIRVLVGDICRVVSTGKALSQGLQHLTVSGWAVNRAEPVFGFCGAQVVKAVRNLGVSRPPDASRATLHGLEPTMTNELTRRQFLSPTRLLKRRNLILVSEVKGENL